MKAWVHFSCQVCAVYMIRLSANMVNPQVGTPPCHCISLCTAMCTRRFLCCVKARTGSKAHCAFKSAVPQMLTLQYTWFQGIQTLLRRMWQRMRLLKTCLDSCER